MTQQRSATPRHDSSAGKRAAQQQRQQLPHHPQPQAARKKPVRQQSVSTQAKAARAQRRRQQRRATLDRKVVGIVAVSAAIVLGVIGFFLYRRGLLDWTGIGMRNVALELTADGWTEESTPLMFHVEGARTSGVAYEHDFVVDAQNTTLRLPQGNFQINLMASPINSDGTIYTVPNETTHVTVSGHTITVEGSDTLAYTLTHLDVIDANDDQINQAISVARQSCEPHGLFKKADSSLTSLVERNVSSLEQLRASSVLPDDLPETLILASTTSGWSTTLTLLADGTFTGVYLQPLPEMVDQDYPNGTAYTCTFSGRFENVERLGELGFRMTLGEVTSEHEVGEKWVADGVLNIGAQPLGVETGTTFELWRPGSETAEMGYWLAAWCDDYANSGIPEKLDRWALDNVDASYGFFSSTVSTQ